MHSDLSGRHGSEPSKRPKSSEGQDMISNLPDFIIGRILSFLSTKDAVRTSALSRRWMYMWTFVTKLSFIDREYSYHSCSYKIRKAFSCKIRKTFSNFVCRVLFHLNSASIQEFYLSISEKYDPYLINQWISAVLNRRVKKISVRSLKEWNLSSYPLFNCQSLEELILAFVMMDRCIIKVPTFVCLSSLTVLNLTGITFTFYSSNELKELTLNFPLLREYKTYGCTWSGLKSVTLEAPLLEVVAIAFDDSPHKSHTEIKIGASHLAKFSYRGPISSETILLDVHIASADIFVFDTNNNSVEEMVIFVRKLLGLLINAECLYLHLCLCRQGLARVERHFASFPSFGMLGHLQLNSVTGGVLLGLLLKSPCLETLVLQMLDSAGESQNFAIVPDCFLSTLKVVKFELFAGRERELSFAKFVMENAKVLERINFKFFPDLPVSEVEKATEKLFLFKRSFSTVIMEFSTYNYRL